VLVRVPDAALYTTTDPGGAYSLLSVPAATYDVTATRDGFATAVRSGVAVQADGTATVDFQLSAASTAVDGTILTPGYSLAPFDLAPAWSSAFDATWGSAASFAIVAPGQTGAALQTSRSGPGSSARVLVLPLRTNTPYQASVWARCPRYSSPYWAECGYRFGAKTAQDFDGNSTAWTLLRRFTDTGVNGNANQWTRYTATFNSGANQQVSFGFKIGATASTGPTVQWDELSLVTLALPVPLAAVAQTETSLVVPFPEPLNPATATNAANYSLLDGAGALWPLGAAGLQGTNVVLETGPLSPRTDFWLTVSNVLLAPQPAQLGGLNGTLPVRLPRPAIALDQTESWRYWASGTDPGAAWQSADFDDSGWAAGPALLGHALGTLPQPIATEISPVPNRYTVYFRRSFVVPPGYTNAWLRLEPIVDDGAVFHLNGAEVLRLGMTNGTFNAGSAATRSVGQADFEGPFILPKAKLVAGRNVLAAELHQSAASDPDLVFGVRADLLVLPSQTPPPDVLLLLSTGPDAWTLSWASAAMVLESAPQIQGPWTPVPDATSPWVIPTADRAGFFRLRE
jgi:hypothetical protein